MTILGTSVNENHTPCTCDSLYNTQVGSQQLYDAFYTSQLGDHLETTEALDLSQPSTQTNAPQMLKCMPGLGTLQTPETLFMADTVTCRSRKSTGVNNSNNGSIIEHAQYNTRALQLVHPNGM